MLCYSTGSLPDAFSFSDIADTLSPTPFRGVELVVTPVMLQRASDVTHWERIRDSYQEKGLTFRNVHLGAPYILGPEAHQPGFSSLNPADRQCKAEAALQAMSIAHALACPHLTLTTGLTESEDLREKQVDALHKILSTLVSQLPKSLVILIEQEPEHVVNATSQLIDLGAAFPGQVFANFDVGHSEVVGENIGDAIRAIGPLLRNIHLEDIKGRVHAHKLYGEGDVDFGAIFTALSDIGYQGDYTPDLYPFKDDYARAIKASEEFLRKHGVLTRAL